MEIIMIIFVALAILSFIVYSIRARFWIMNKIFDNYRDGKYKDWDKLGVSKRIRVFSIIQVGILLIIGLILVWFAFSPKSLSPLIAALGVMLLTVGSIIAVLMYRNAVK